MKKTILLFSSLMMTAGLMHGQTTVVATGLTAPIGISHGPAGMLLVAESGSGVDDGEITAIDPSSGMMQTLIYGLPSNVDTLTGETTGPWRAYMRDSMLWVVQGKGPNPDAGSLIAFDMNMMMPGDSMTVSDADTIINISQWALSNGFADSNPYSVTWDSTGNTFIADAGANAVFMMDSAGMLSVYDTFPPVNGSIDYVPTKIISGMNGELFLCNLTGFPFMPGLSEVVMVDSLSHSTVVSGLSQCVDMKMDSMNNMMVLQFGSFDQTTFAPIMNSASIVRIDMTGNIDTIAWNFGPSAGMMPDTSGGFFATEVLTGNLVHISDMTTSVKEIPTMFTALEAYPNPFSDKITCSYTLAATSEVVYTLTDQLGNQVFTKTEQMQKGAHTVSFELNEKQNLATGIYFLTVSANDQSQTISVVRK